MSAAPMLVPAREQGAALLAVLLLVALIAAMAVLAMDRVGLATHVAGNARAIDQGRAYAFGTEALVSLIVDDLTDRSAGAVPLPAGWQQEVRDIPVEGGMIHAIVRDGGNCFNLNSLVSGNALVGWKARPQGMDQFQTLLRLLGQSDANARAIVAASTDWIDSDGITQPSGAEDLAYADAPIPYRPANSLMADPTELRAVAGMTPVLYARLRPWICAQSDSGLSAINVNTIRPGQGLLLAMLYGGRMGAAQAENIIRGRPSGGWHDVAAFLSGTRLGALANTTGLDPVVDVRSRWFTLDLDVSLDGAQVKERALIDAGIAPARVVRREWGEGE